jgi:hypothetical protein
LAAWSLPTHSWAVAKATRWPRRAAFTPKAIDRCVLPVPGGPKNTTFFCLAQEIEFGQVGDLRALDRPLMGKVEVIQGLYLRETRGLHPV